MKAGQPISQQINSVSRSLIAGLVVVSLLAVATTFLIRSIFVDYRATARTTLISNAVLEDMFEAKIAALKWRVIGDAVHIEGVRGNLAEIRAAEADFASLGGDAPEIRNFLEALRADLSRYEAEFSKMLQAHEQYLVAEQNATASGIAARRALTDIMTLAHEGNDPTATFHVGRAQEALMLGRYYLERFRQSEATSDIDRAFTELSRSQDDIRMLVKALQDPRQRGLADLAATEIEKLIESKGELVATVANRASARNAMDQLGPKVIADVEAVVDSAVDRQNTLGPQGDQTSFWAVALMVGASATIIFFGLRFSKRIASRLTGEIEVTVDSMTRIANGDLEAEVKHAELDNEIGHMAQALEVFKANGKAAIANAEREKVAEEERRAATEAARRAQEEGDRKAREEASAARREMISTLSQSVGRVVAAASEGDFSGRVEAKFDDAELTRLTDGVNALVENVEKGLFATGRVLGKIAEGDLTQKMDGNFKGAFAELQTVTNQMVASLETLVGEIVESGKTLGASSGELQESSAGLSRQAEQNAAAIEETSAALEELSASLNQVNDNVSDANDNVRETSKTAKSSGEVAQSAADAMNRIAEASSEISKVVSVINDIAFQINLLALNAGVEAARAGSAGQGFSVVAAEVRQLSQRASEAAKEIANVIDRSDTAVAEGVAKVADAQASLAKISESVVGISDRIGDVANSIKEQVLGVTEINNAISQVDQNTQRQAATAEELTASSSLLASESQSLLASTDRFEIGNSAMPRSSGPVQPASKTVSKSVVESRPAQPIPAAASNLAVDEDDWEDF